jgi:GT2 family glycosyltransferase
LKIDNSTAIVCVTYDLDHPARQHDFTRFLNSIPDSSSWLGDVVLVIVDSKMSASTLELLKLHCKFRFEYIPFAENVGYSVANNAGLSRSRVLNCEYTLFCNPDIVLYNNVVKVLFPLMQKDDRSAITFGQFDSPSGNSIDFRNSDLTLKTILRNKLRLPREITPLFTGCCFLAKTHLLSECGGFPDRFFLYGEEIEMQRRINSLGYHTLAVPTAVCRHSNGENDAHILTPIWAVAKANTFRLLRTGEGRGANFYPVLAILDGLITRPTILHLRSIIPVARSLTNFLKLSRKVSKNPNVAFDFKSLTNL